MWRRGSGFGRRYILCNAWRTTRCRGSRMFPGDWRRQNTFECAKAIYETAWPCLLILDYCSDFGIPHRCQAREVCFDVQRSRRTISHRQAYTRKELVRARPLAHIRIFFKDVAQLLGLLALSLCTVLCTPAG